MSKRIEEIRERLGNATPGPWEDDGVNVTQANGEWADVTPSRVECMSYCYGGSVERMKDDDRTFIANAPADVAFLLAEVERLEGELAKTKRGAVTLGKIIDRQGRAVLDITGLHRMVDEDMDGDWGAIWDILAEQAAKGRLLQEEKAEAWDEGRHFGQINDHAYPNVNPYRTAK